MLPGFTNPLTMFDDLNKGLGELNDHLARIERLLAATLLVHKHPVSWQDHIDAPPEDLTGSFDEALAILRADRP